ncbi:MAG: type II secretion system protein GspG [Alphaproteobacteria bacterium]|nr:type II secretion system protein GspG [Alphaproteobacteria bacterium]
MGRDLGHYPALAIAFAVMFAIVLVGGGVVLFATVGLGFVSYSVGTAMSDAQSARAELELQAALQRVQLFHLENGRWPSSLDEVYAPEPPPRDPWGNPIRYRWSGLQPEVSSLGPDGMPGVDDIEVRP